jgi:hypothetical protein
MRKRIIILGCAGIASLFDPANLAAKEPVVTIELVRTFQVPGSKYIVTGGINEGGDIAGSFYGRSEDVFGFIRRANGELVGPFSDPSDTGKYTIANGINQSQICGFYRATDGVKGFFRSGATFTSYAVPGASFTQLFGLNQRGDFAGSYALPGQPYVGFVNVKGAIESFAVPGASETLAYGINRNGDAVGQYQSDTGLFHGFTRACDGTVAYPVDVPNSYSTFLYGVNDEGYIIGSYEDQQVNSHGLLVKRPHTVVTFDVPGSSLTILTGINNSGQIAGYAVIPGDKWEGFIAQIHAQ